MERCGMRGKKINIKGQGEWGKVMEKGRKEKIYREGSTWSWNIPKLKNQQSYNLVNHFFI